MALMHNKLESEPKNAILLVLPIILKMRDCKTQFGRLITKSLRWLKIPSLRENPGSTCALKSYLVFFININLKLLKPLQFISVFRTRVILCLTSGGGSLVVGAFCASSSLLYQVKGNSIRRSVWKPDSSQLASGSPGEMYSV